MMKFFVFLWFAIELLQISIIGMLFVGYRRLQRRIEGEEYRFTHHPPPSVVDEK